MSERAKARRPCVVCVEQNPPPADRAWTLLLPLHPDPNRPEHPILLAVDQQLAKIRLLLVAPERRPLLKQGVYPLIKAMGGGADLRLVEEHDRAGPTRRSARGPKAASPEARLVSTSHLGQRRCHLHPDRTSNAGRRRPGTLSPIRWVPAS